MVSYEYALLPITFFTMPDGDLCNTHLKTHIGIQEPNPPCDTYCSLCITVQTWGTKTKHTSKKLLHRIVTPLFSDGALLAGAYGGMTRNRLADTLNEGLRAEQTDSSSLYATVVNTLCMIQSGRQRQRARGKEVTPKEKEAIHKQERELRLPAPSSSPVTQLITRTTSCPMWLLL